MAATKTQKWMFIDKGLSKHDTILELELCTDNCDEFDGVPFEYFEKRSTEPKQKTVLSAEVGHKGRADGNILPAVNALLGCRKIDDVLKRGIPTLNNFIAMIIPHK